MDTNVQHVFLEAAKQAARNERVLSIEDGERSLDKLKSKGVTVVQLSESDLADVKAKTQSVYDKYNSGYFDSGLIEKIQKH